jgi:hypothetical protein
VYAASAYRGTILIGMTRWSGSRGVCRTQQPVFEIASGLFPALGQPHAELRHIGMTPAELQKLLSAYTTGFSVHGGRLACRRERTVIQA